MAKKLSLQQKNRAKLELLLKQKVSTSSGFISNDFKQFIAEELINAANNNKKSIKGNESLQQRYNKFKKYYDKLFSTGLSGHALFTGQIEKNYRKDEAKGTEYYISENGKEKKVSYAELAYKIELFAHKLSTKHDVAFTKIKPTYYLIGKGKYKVVINIPDLKEADFEEMTTEEVMEWFDDNNIEVIISDPNKIKGKKQKKEWEDRVKKRQVRIEANKKKHYQQWKKEKKPLKKKEATKKKK